MNGKKVGFLKIKLSLNVVFSRYITIVIAVKYKY